MLKTAVVAFIAIAWCGAAFAGPADTDNDDARAYAKANQDILAFYPKDALAKSINGSATLSCHRTSHDKPIDCTLVSEKPAGQGFGAAALAISTAAVDRPEVDVPADLMDKPWKLTFDFRASPASIMPNLLLPFGALELWTYRRIPPAEDMLNFYPRRALVAQIPGDVGTLCTIQDDGRLRDCEVLFESPPDQGFGAPSLAMMDHFQLNPTVQGGYSISGERFMMHIHWNPPPPSMWEGSYR